MNIVICFVFFFVGCFTHPPLPPLPPGIDISLLPPENTIEDEIIQEYEAFTKISAEKGGFFEGDIVLRDEPVLDSAIVNTTAIWPYGLIYYSFGAEFTNDEKNIIKNAINRIINVTCLTFLEIEKNVITDYILFRKLYGCYSFIGRQGGEQILSIGEGCLIEGIIIHEMLHSLGFWHEQSRYDRDDHVEIRWNNIYPDKEKNFQKYTQREIQHLNVPYDYSSIMHYNAHAFSRDGISPTIITKTGASIGQREKLSTFDILKLNRLYCKDLPPTPPTIPTIPTVPTVPTSPQKCNDVTEICPFWAVNGHCVKNRRYMQTYCRKSCAFCTTNSQNCFDHHSECTGHLAKNYCVLFPEYTFTMCKKSCNYC